MTPTKPTKKKQKKIYWPSDIDDYIIEYNTETDLDIKEKIFRDHLYFPLDKLSESIINRFKFPYIDGSFEDVKSQVISYLVLSLHKFTPDKGKSFSYFSVIAKNYLILHNNKRYKEEKRLIYLSDYLSDSSNSSYNTEELLLLNPDDEHNIADSADFIKLIINYWEFNTTKIFKKDRDIEIAYAIIELLKRAQYIDNFNKKAIYILIREITNYETSHITKVVKKMREIIYNQLIEYKQTGWISDSSNFFIVKK